MPKKCSPTLKDKEKQAEIPQHYFRKMWGDSKPLAKLFKTNSCSYLYDTGTNKILRCNDKVFDLLEKLLLMDISSAINEFSIEYGRDEFLQAASKIQRVMEDEGVLSPTKAVDFSLSDHFNNYEELIGSSLEILFLEITENCNLRCDYCIYGDHVRHKRNHSNRRMSEDVLKSAVDYLNKHSSKNDKVNIAFYGGEPLLELPLIRSSLDYAKQLMKKKEIDFSITTNATLLTLDTAAFLFENNFRVYVSIDGPEEIHDSYRKDTAGRGSFKKSLGGLKTLIETYGESYRDMIILSMVYTPPFSTNRINRITELWKENSWLPEDIKLSITYPTRGTIPAEKHPGIDTQEDKDLRQWAYDKYWEKYTAQEQSHTLSDSLIESRLAQLMQRPVFHEPFDKYYLNGCCVPAVRRLYVSADGTFRVCERIASNAPTIGNVFSGTDIDVIRKIYIHGYEKLSRHLCSECWAVRLCTSCYIDVFKDGNLDMVTKKNNCILLKDSIERDLVFFCSLMEHDSKKLKELYKMELR